MIHEKGEPLEEALVVVRLEQFLKLKQEAWENAGNDSNDTVNSQEAKQVKGDKSEPTRRHKETT